MKSSVNSDPTQQLVDLIQSNAALRSEVQNRPDLLALFVRATEVAAKISADRSRLIAAITKAADASDTLIETIRSGNAQELAARLLLAAQSIETLGDILKEFFPIAVAMSGSASRKPN